MKPEDLSNLQGCLNSVEEQDLGQLSPHEELENVPANEETAMETEETPKIPKKRGRKKKIVEQPTANCSILSPDADISLSEQNETAVDTSVPKPKGKRGRKRRTDPGFVSATGHVELVVVTEPVTNTDSIEQTSTGRRVRKKKVDLYVESPSDDATDSESQTEIFATPVKSIRGRKKKTDSDKSLNVKSPAVEASDSEDEMETEKPVKSKRGRKKKVIPVVVESDTDAASDETPKMSKRKALANKETPGTPLEIAPMPLFKKGRPSKVELQQRIAIEKQIKQSVTEFTCGNCKAVIPAKAWNKHSKIHYGIYWRDGIDAPIVSTTGSHNL